jgi:hypothetical protein
MKRPIPKKKNPLEQQTDFMKVYDLITAHVRYFEPMLSLVETGGKHA